jgi:CRISPR-associated protein Csd1
MVTGQTKPMAVNHPKRIRNSGDGAKLISSNDKSGFTFLGRFLLDEFKKDKISIQAASISAEISQKAHSALRWLIDRQGFRNGDQVIVSWAVSGKVTPDAFADSLSIFDESDEERIKELSATSYSDAGQTFARKLSKKIAGYNAKLGPTDKIIVLGLDSAGPGRISITYYRELTGSDFLNRIENWHKQMAWHFHIFINDSQDKKKFHGGDIIYAPSTASIAEVCYGTKRDEDFKKFKKSIIERLLPCIIDGRPLPIDIVFTAVNKASNKIAFEKAWQWEQALSVACAIYSGDELRKNKLKTDKIMALEIGRNDRDYLYGRLLAVAEHLEEAALNSANEKRETTAARLMQRFADFPYPTWRNIESALVPYKSRLQANRPAVLYKMKILLDEIHAKFLPGEYEKDGRLSGTYLLGYHCQRLEMAYKKVEDEKETITNNQK